MVPRRVRLTIEDFQKHGYTENCPECTHILTGVGHRKAHSEACRKRMQEALVQDADRKMVEGEERINTWIEDRHKKLTAGEETGDTKVTDDSHKTKDYWKVSDDGREVTRVHVQPRMALFTPCNAGYPVPTAELTKSRKTKFKVACLADSSEAVPEESLVRSTMAGSISNTYFY